MAVINPQQLLQNLFKTVESPTAPSGGYVQKGSICTFGYVGQTRQPIHDPYPMVLISDIFSDKIRGINLHYLTLTYVRAIIRNPNLAGNSSFSYKNISGDQYIVNAFRSYKRVGISNLRKLDVRYLQNLLTVSQSLDVGEIERMRQQIREIINNSMRQPEVISGETEV